MDPVREPLDSSSDLGELKARYERLRLLYHVSNVIHSTLDPPEALRLILSEAVRLVKASSGSIVLVNPTTGFLEIEASHCLPREATALKLRVGEGITGWVARHGKPARVGKVSDDPRYIMVRPNVRSELAVPLEVNGEVRGVLNVDSDREDAFDEEAQELLEELATQAAKVIHNTWLYEQVRLKARLFESLNRVGHTINSTLNLDDALRVITREACALMEAKMCSLLMLDESGEWLNLRASHGAGKGYVTKPRLSVAESFVGIVLRRRKPMQLENVQISSRYHNVEIARQEQLVSLLSVPLVFGEEALGVLSVYTGQPHNFSNEEIRILAALAELSAVAISKARLYERIVDLEEQLRKNEKLSAIGLLAAEVAHEIRNPLTVMKMLYHSLNLEFPAGDLRAKDYRIIGQKMDHLNRIVENVLALARNTEPRFEEVQINQLVDDLALLTRHKLTNQGIRLVQKLCPDLPLVRGDATQLEQVFLNLTLNAVEAMPKGGQLTIVTRQVPASRHTGQPTRVAIEFTDTGQGIPAEQRGRIFSSLLDSSKPRGTGLGLAIVGRIVEAHGGKIQVRSRPGRGSKFTLSFPCA